MKPAARYRYRIMILYCILLFLIACRADGDRLIIESKGEAVCAVLAHPDDETIIGGTLALLADQGRDLTVVYVTSGDDGPDMTGKGLHGEALAEVREKEAIKALEALGIQTFPVFLRYPDSFVIQYMDSVQQILTALLDSINPAIVIGFGPDGITGDWDHRSAGLATDNAFDLIDSGRLLLHMAITKPFPPFYAYGVAVPRDSVDVRVRVSGYSRQRSLAVAAHETQFSRGVRSAYKAYVHTMRKEKYIIARNRNNSKWQKD